MEPVSGGGVVGWSLCLVVELLGGACVYDDGACVYDDGACVYVNHSIIESPQVPCPF